MTANDDTRLNRNNSVEALTPEEPDNKTPDISDLYTCLSATRRCYAIEILAESDEGSVSVSDLARQITAVENSIRVDHATGEQYRNVYSALKQYHLDKLAAADIIRVDSERDRVVAGESLEAAYLLLNINRETYEILL